MLQQRAMLATLIIHQWTNRRGDKSVTDQVERAHGATDAGRFNKTLIDKAALDPINKIASAARMYHYRVTLPWGDNGDRLLPSKLFFDYTTAMRQYRSEFDARVVTLVNDYPRLKQEARVRLNTLYNPDDYPLDIAQRFGIETSFAPVPAAEDFRVDIGTEQLELVRSSLTEALTARQANAAKDCWARVRKVVENIHERLSDEEKTFHDTLISNARDLVEILPALNFMGDPELDTIAEDVKTLLVNPVTLRADTGIRKNTADAAAEILARLPWA